MNGLRLGTYQTLVNTGLTENKEGESVFGKTVLAGALGGCLGGIVASPLYLVSKKGGREETTFFLSLYDEAKKDDMEEANVFYPALLDERMK